jgi:hypothetical protein
VEADESGGAGEENVRHQDHSLAVASRAASSRHSNLRARPT